MGKGRLTRGPRHEPDPEPVLSVIIPAYNEVARLPATLAATTAYLVAAPYLSEVIVVDDGSHDGTAEVTVTDAKQAIRLRVISRPRNGGKGAAIRDGLRVAKGQYVLIMDADLSTPIREVDRLLRIARAGTPIVIGSRYVRPGSVKVRQPLHRIVVSRLGNKLIQRTLLPGIRDTQCGFKLLHRQAARAIEPKLTRSGFSIDIELLSLARRFGYEVAEEPVEWSHAAGTRLRVPSATAKLLRDLVWIRRNVLKPDRSARPSVTVAEPRV
jgi:glycosyltransferase involved in cell wall biosynthesis